MKIDSALTMMNRLIKNTVKIFGINSEEYGRLKYLAESMLPNDSANLFIKHEKNMPVQFRRSKKAIQGLKIFETDVKDTIEAMRRFGTVLQQAKKYDPTMTSSRLDKPIDRKTIKQLAMRNAAINMTVIDWYSSIDDIEDPKAQAVARSLFRKTGGLKGQAFNEKADEAIEYVREALKKQGESIIDGTAWKVEQKGTKQVIGKSQTLAEALAKQKG